MTVMEKVSYLKGLAEGLGLDENDKRDKIIGAIIDTLEGIAESIETIEVDIADVSDQLDAVDEDLAEVEEYVYEEDEEYDDEDFFPVKCPECGEEIFVDDDALGEDYIICPKCGTKLEFDFGCDCGCEDCDHSDSEEESK